MASAVEFAMYIWFVRVLEEYLTVYPVGQTIGLETAFEMLLPHKTAIRKPDLGVVLHSNTIGLPTTDRRYHGIFDICIESVSASSRKEIERDTVVKRGEYGSAGVKEYYILDERGTETVFLEQVGGIYRPLTDIDGIITSNVLPNFRFRLDDLYRRPSLIALAQDSVYEKFILPEYNQERLRADRAEIRADKAQLRADRERLRADGERLKAKSHKQQLLNTARNLLPLFEDAHISTMTGLDLETIEQLRQELT